MEHAVAAAAVSTPQQNVEAMDGLSSIRPEIEAFISRENRSHADKWLQQVNWAENERTLTLYIQKPPSGDATDTRVPIGVPGIATAVCSIFARQPPPPLSSSSMHVLCRALAPLLCGSWESVQIPPLFEGERR